MPFPLNAVFVARAEEKLGATLPPLYVAKMLKSNGGELELEDDDWQLHPILDESDPKRMARTCNDIVRETDEAKRWSGFPAQAVSIAANAAGDHLIFLRNNDESFDEKVYIWRHETQEVVVAQASAREIFAAS